MSVQVVDKSLVEAVPEGYLTMRLAMAEIGRAKSTVERLDAAGDVKSMLVARAGRKPERVYLAADLVRWREARERRKELRPPSQRAKQFPTTALAPSPQTSGIAIRGDVMTGLREVLDKFLAGRNAVGVRDKLWLTWDEASELSGIPRAALKRLAREGRIQAERFGDATRVRRASLETYGGAPAAKAVTV